MNTNPGTMETVCIIDDDKIHHFTIEKTIQLEGLSKHLLSFHDGQEAIAFFTENLSNANILPDIIFLDLNMPIVNGWQFLKQYAEFKSQIPKNIRIYVVSSSINEHEINEATAVEGVSGFFEKPLRPEKIRQVFLNNN